MPKNIPVAVRLKGMELYVANSMSAREIAEHLTVNYNVSVKPPTIYAWARKYDWDTKRTEVATQADDKIVQSEATKVFQLQDEQLRIYTDIREKAYNELGNLNFTRALDAVKAADVGIQGERRVLEGLINLQFVQEVMRVLVDEIDDGDLLASIAGKLKLLVSTEEQNAARSSNA
tara:strand:- start:28 stop:552 length:525 start_codon:yes stop_codon:yes gene_type:complete